MADGCAIECSSSVRNFSVISLGSSISSCVTRYGLIHRNRKCFEWEIKARFNSQFNSQKQKMFWIRYKSNETIQLHTGYNITVQVLVPIYCLWTRSLCSKNYSKVIVLVASGYNLNLQTTVTQSNTIPTSNSNMNYYVWTMNKPFYDKMTLTAWRRNYVMRHSLGPNHRRLDDVTQ